jgi:tetratricopeptide (TPR) repeat protein
MTSLKCIAASILFCFLAMPPALAQTDTTTSVEVIQAEGLMGDGKYQDALSLLNHAIAEHPQDARALVDRGDVYEDLNQQQNAISDYTAALAINPEYAYAWASRCESRHELNIDAAALDDCDRAIELDPHDAYAYRERALIELDQSEPQKALQDAQEAVELDGNAISYEVRCHVNVEMGRNGNAVDDCSTALNLGYTGTAPYFYRGRAEIAQSSWQQAVTDFKAALASDAEDTNAYYWLALAEHNLGTESDALHDIESYITASPDDGDGYLLRARIQQSLGRSADAIASATSALHYYEVDNDTDGMGNARTLLQQLGAAPATPSP